MNRPKEMPIITALLLVLGLVDAPLLLWRAHLVSAMLFIAATVVVRLLIIWGFWEGFNGARLLVIFGAVMTLYYVTRWNHTGLIGHLLIAPRALLAGFLLWWLNTTPVKQYFRRQKEPRLISGRRD